MELTYADVCRLVKACVAEGHDVVVRVESTNGHQPNYHPSRVWRSMPTPQEEGLDSDAVNSDWGDWYCAATPAYWNKWWPPAALEEALGRGDVLRIMVPDVHQRFEKQIVFKPDSRTVLHEVTGIIPKEARM